MMDHIIILLFCFTELLLKFANVNKYLKPQVSATDFFWGPEAKKFEKHFELFQLVKKDTNLTFLMTKLSF